MPIPGAVSARDSPLCERSLAEGAAIPSNAAQCHWIPALVGDA